MIDEVCTEPSLFPVPHYCTPWQLGTRLHWVYWWALNCIHDDIFHTAHSIIAILIPFSLSGNFFTDCMPSISCAQFQPWYFHNFFLAFGENTSSSSPLNSLQKLPLLGASGAMCYPEWQMIIWLRLPSSYIYKSSSTRYTEYHNNHMMASSHIQIINLIVEVLYSCFSCSGTGAWSRFSSTHARHRARAHFPAVQRRPHIYRAVIVPADKCGSIFNTLAVYCGFSFTLLYFYDCSEHSQAATQDW